ncbi:hypothetical protein ENUP19_0121G0111 [Entamoeba nuttalli]|uniref:FG-GAP repeat-containing protein n=2 Tax=Entamoeba nuttalli TaxID=412467 RepID=K2H558_ENTNP|nr:FG-GAP repeat-containing protein [Entamoeba nuttalli P19]EKE42653.1 FG-GAP repeat-containing protein [Entamoeba nuttalli P19]|eukprot:XP_008855008.1 FG-GAP repeat-containing protein [Entamoeba nuttalli P19]
MNTIKWIILIFCFAGWYYLVHHQRVSDLELIFKYKYSGNPTSELNAVPIITDIDGDGINDIVLAPFASKKLSMYSVKKGSLVLKKEVDLPEKSFPIYITSGYDKKYDDTEKRSQIIIVIMRDFEVICFNPDLTIRWRQNYYKSKAKAYVQEVSAIVVPYDIQTKYQGAVIAAFRTSYDEMLSGNRADKEFEEDFRVTLQQTFDEQKEDLINDDFDPEDMLKEHMNYYSFSTKDGQLIWQHETDEKDEYLELIEQNTDEIEKYKKFKIFSSFTEEFGEIQWHEFHDAVFQNMPHQWTSYYDTKIIPSHFARDMVNNPTQLINPKTKDIKYPYNSFDLIKNPNVFVVHQKNGIEVIHLFTGKPLLHVSLSSSTLSSASAFADIDGDDSLDEIFTHQFAHTLDYSRVDDDISCQVQAMTMGSFKFLFSQNACTKARRFDLLRRKQENVEVIILPPLLVPNQEIAHDGRPKFDIILLNNLGLMTSVSNNGALKWQAEVQSYWDLEEKNAKTFKPSIVSFKFTYGKNETDPFIVSQGSRFVNVVDLNGNVIAKKEFDHICKPIMPPVFGDVNNDKKNDIVIVTDDHIMAYKMEVVPSVEFLPICIASLIILISYNIYIVAINYYKKLE